MNDSNDILPPHSIDAERCVLASMMIIDSPSQRKLAFAKVQELIDRESFFLADHQIIFDVLIQLNDHNRPIDAVIIGDELTKRQLLAEVGGVQYLATILDSVPSASHLHHYAGIVAEKCKLRRLISMGTEIIRRAQAPTDAVDPADEILNFVIAETVMAQQTNRASTINVLGESARNFLKRRQTEGAGRIYCGLTAIDDAIGGFARKRMHVVGGRPGSGKSLTGKQIALSIAKGVTVNRAGKEPYTQDPIAIGLISIEEDDEKISQNMLSNASGIDNNKIVYGTATEEEWTEVEKSIEELDGLPYYTTDAAFTLSAVRNVATRMVLEHKCQVIVIDYLQLVDPEMRQSSETDKVTAISKALKFLGKQLNVVMIVCAQLSRANDKDCRKPRMSDLRNSGQIEQDSDVILLLHREDYYRCKEPDYHPNHKLEIDVAKNKDGPTPEITLRFQGRTQSLSDYRKEGHATARPDHEPSAKDLEALKDLYS